MKLWSGRLLLASPDWKAKSRNFLIRGHFVLLLQSGSLIIQHKLSIFNLESCCRIGFLFCFKATCNLRAFQCMQHFMKKGYSSNFWNFSEHMSFTNTVQPIVQLHKILAIIYIDFYYFLKKETLSMESDGDSVDLCCKYPDFRDQLRPSWLWQVLLLWLCNSIHIWWFHSIRNPSCNLHLSLHTCRLENPF